MAMNEPFDWRRYDRRLFAIAAVAFPLLVLIGFGRTFYLKFAFDTPPLRSLIVHAHGLVMTLWVLFFVTQIWLIRAKDYRRHMNFGLLGIGLAVLIIVTGFFTAAFSAKYGFTGIGDIDPRRFAVIPIIDLVVFVLLFGAAIIYRKRLADHKRLMLLTAINFLPPAIARIPLDFVAAAGPPFFFGVPAAITIALLIIDTVANRKLNKAFLIGSLVLIASYPLRLMLMGTQAWMDFAIWITTWAA
jgi:uncharacterized membrane protein YozB (DUF420 family)